MVCWKNLYAYHNSAPERRGLIQGLPVHCHRITLFDSHESRCTQPGSGGQYRSSLTWQFLSFFPGFINLLQGIFELLYLFIFIGFVWRNNQVSTIGGNLKRGILIDFLSAA